MIKPCQVGGCSLQTVCLCVTNKDGTVWDKADGSSAWLKISVQVLVMSRARCENEFLTFILAPTAQTSLRLRRSLKLDDQVSVQVEKRKNSLSYTS